MSQAYKTAISRKTASAPTKWLGKERRLLGKVLDWGCGKGKDVEWLREASIPAEGYDPHWRKYNDFYEGEFDIIICNFVLNVIENPLERDATLKEMLVYLRQNGRAYVSVRADKEMLNGVTKIGTWQGYIKLEAPWKLLHKTGSYELYEYIKPY
jgi:ubiquinone/menaquinone biosynthesis C-methylase UbiE